ncbi:unnamed protein product, partial [Mesorhabditis belari]|uniref:KAT8 regulatory NSL complex subunit 2 n=1 Tax=Mesorhabditis belari TaxID=2138241 RepID=A0AAF3EBE6_9BILA
MNDFHDFSHDWQMDDEMADRDLSSQPRFAMALMSTDSNYHMSPMNHSRMTMDGEENDDSKDGAEGLDEEEERKAPKRKREKNQSSSIQCQNIDETSRVQCKQRAIISYQYCIRHILLDPSAPYKQCLHQRKPKSKRDTNLQCTNAVKNGDDVFCSTHMIMKGLKEPKKKPGGSGKTNSSGGTPSLTHDSADVSMEGQAPFSPQLSSPPVGMMGPGSAPPPSLPLTSPLPSQPNTAPPSPHIHPHHHPQMIGPYGAQSHMHQQHPSTSLAQMLPPPGVYGHSHGPHGHSHQQQHPGHPGQHSGHMQQHLHGYPPPGSLPRSPMHAPPQMQLPPSRNPHLPPPIMHPPPHGPMQMQHVPIENQQSNQHPIPTQTMREPQQQQIQSGPPVHRPPPPSPLAQGNITTFPPQNVPQMAPPPPAQHPSPAKAPPPTHTIETRVLPTAVIETRALPSVPPSVHHMPLQSPQQMNQPSQQLPVQHQQQPQMQQTAQQQQIHQQTQQQPQATAARPSPPPSGLPVRVRQQPQAQPPQQQQAQPQQGSISRQHPQLAARLLGNSEESGKGQPPPPQPPQTIHPAVIQEMRNDQARGMPLPVHAPPMRPPSPDVEPAPQTDGRQKMIHLKQKRQKPKMIGEYRKVPHVDHMCRQMEDADFDSTDLFPLGLEPSDDEWEPGPSGCDTSLSSCLAVGDDADVSTQLYLTKKQLRLERHNLIRHAHLNVPLLHVARRFPTAAGAALRHRLMGEPPCDSAPRKQRVCSHHDQSNGRCRLPCIPMSNHCAQHVLYNVDQRLFSYCRENGCGRAVMNIDSQLWEGMCRMHRKGTQPIPGDDALPQRSAPIMSSAQRGNDKRRPQMDDEAWGDIADFLLAEGYHVDSPQSQSTPAQSSQLSQSS